MYTIDSYRFAAPTTLLDDLVSWWALDEESGVRADSVIATGNDLTDNNTVGFDTGVVNNAALFDAGADETLSITNGDQTGLNFGDTDYSGSFWVNWTAFDVGAFFLLTKADDAGNDKSYQLFHRGSVAGSELRLSVGDGGSSTIGTATTTATFTSTGVWYHVFWYHSATDNEVGIIINDGTPDTAATSGAAGDSAQDFVLGGRQTAPEHRGLLDEVGIWNRKLTAAEITELYNSGSGIGYPG